MPKLDDEQKLFVVQCLAMHDTPSEVAEKVKEEFGVEIDRRHAQCYDPTKFAGRHLADKWVQTFFATRKSFLENVSSIPIANAAVRVRRLEHLFVKHAGKRGNPKLAQEVLEQAAKETGGAYTNRRELSGPGGKPIEAKVETFDMSKLSDSALKEIADLSS